MDEKATGEPKFDGVLCRGARALLGMSQLELCAVAGCGRKLLNDFENGVTQPKNSKIAAMKGALEDAGAVFVRIDDMMTIGVRPGHRSMRSARARSFSESRQTSG